MDFAFPPTEAEGRRGQIAAAHRQMVELFGDDAPQRNAISRWRDGQFVIGLDNAYMLAVALGVRPSWLAFNDGAMGEAAVTLPKRTRARRPIADLTNPRRDDRDTG